MRETIKNTERMERCPNFDECSAPKCPLDEFISVRVSYPEDPICTLPKEKRMELGEDLPRHGLTYKEFNGIISSYGSWEAYISDEQKT